MDASPTERQPTARANAGRVAAFLAVLALCIAAGWQAGRLVEPPLPVPATSTTTHDVHSGMTQ